MTPREFSSCFAAYVDSRDSAYKAGWEQTRTLVYYQYIAIPKKGNNPSFQRFKLQHLPFPWDKIKKITDEDDVDVMQQAEEEQGLTPNDWLERIKKIQESSISRELKTSEVKSI